MSKKSFKSGFDGLLGEPLNKVKSDIGTVNIKETKTQKSRIGVRTTLIINEDNIEKIKAIAYWDRKLLKDIVNEALEAYIFQYTEKNGEIKPIER